jgi:hypothetical protein
MLSTNSKFPKLYRMKPRKSLWAKCPFHGKGRLFIDKNANDVGLGGK